MSKTLKISLVVIVALGLAVVGGIFWFLRDDAPAEVSLESATEGVTESTVDDGDTSTTVAAGANGVTGTWTVDTETGDFDYESATGTFAGFRIQEELASIGSTTAVGRTGDVAGTVEIDGTTVSAASVEIDLTTITTNESRRDDKVQSALETGQYPTATFTLTQPIELDPAALDGEPASVTAVGELTIHGVTQPAEFALDVQLVDDSIVIVGSTDVTFSDFGVEVPESMIVVSVEDHGTLEVQVLLTRS